MNQWNNEPDWMSKWKQTFDDGTWYIIEKHIKKIKLTNIGRFKNFHAEFNDFTIILGPYGSGKTTIANAISQVNSDLHINHFQLIKLTEKQANIHIETNSNQDLILNQKKKQIIQNNQCFVLDELGSRLTKEAYYEFLTCLQQLPYQIILTANHHYLDTIERFTMKNKNCHIIELPL